MARQRFLGTATIVPCKHGFGELKIAADRPLKKESMLEVVISTAKYYAPIWGQRLELIKFYTRLSGLCV